MSVNYEKILDIDGKAYHVMGNGEFFYYSLDPKAVPPKPKARKDDYVAAVYDDILIRIIRPVESILHVITESPEVIPAHLITALLDGNKEQQTIGHYPWEKLDKLKEKYDASTLAYSLNGSLYVGHPDNRATDPCLGWDGDWIFKDLNLSFKADALRKFLAPFKKNGIRMSLHEVPEVDWRILRVRDDKRNLTACILPKEIEE